MNPAGWRRSRQASVVDGACGGARPRPARSRARKDNSELGVLAGADVDFSRAAMLLHDDVMAKGKAEARFLRQRASGMPVSAESCRRSRCSMLRHVPLNSGVSLLPVAPEPRACRILMSIPGVGAITATSFATAIEDPDNFKKSRAVGAWLGLTRPCRDASARASLRSGGGHPDPQLGRQRPAEWAEPFRLMGCTAGSAECVVHRTCRS